MSFPESSVAVEGIQRHLEAIYAIDCPERARDFLIDDEALGQLKAAGLVDPGLRPGPEHLLLLDGETGLELALYLEDGLHDRLGRGADLQDHCHATEGVSHFLFLLWMARQGRPVRCFDLEFQAEVDKASTCLLLDRGTTGGAGAKNLIDRLFLTPRLLPDLEPEERRRYLEAHRLGARYAKVLLRRMDDGVEAVLSELRRFYRLPLQGKRERVFARAS